jgi:alpha-methylacyl-CoA racemase
LAREGFIKIDDVVQPAPAPRFSNTQCEVESIPNKPGEHTESILRSLGYDDNFIQAFQICHNANVA